MPSTKYLAYHIDPNGVPRASYELNASRDEDAQIQARWFLKLHPSIEVWQGTRQVVRLVREEPASLMGH